MRTVFVLFTLVFLIALVSPVAAQDDGPTLTATVVFEVVRLRFGPGTDYPVGAEARQNDILTIDGRTADNSWYRVVPASGPPVWVAEFLVSVDDGNPDDLPVFEPPSTDDYALIVPPGCEYFNIGPLRGTVAQPIFLTQGWEAATEELVEDYLDNVVQIVTFDDRIIGTYASYASDIIFDEDRQTWQVFWEFRMGSVSAGAHRIEWTQMFDREVTDGLDDDGDGVHNTYGPGVVMYGCTIIIAE